MNITGDKVTVNKSIEDVYALVSEPGSYKKIMPSTIDKFETNDQGFVFALKGMPEIALKFKEKVPNTKVVLTSAKDSLTFDLSVFIEKITDTSSKVQFTFDGKFNMFILAMVEKPLRNFIKSLTEGIGNLK